MFRSSVTRAVRAAHPSSAPLRTLATAASPSSTNPPVTPTTRNHKVLVVGGGSAGLSVSHQLLHKGPYTQDDIAIIEPSEWHHFQPGWTLVGGGVKTKEELRRPTPTLVDGKLKLYGQAVESFTPEQNTVTLANGDRLGYEQLIVVPGIHVNFGNSIRGLAEALADPNRLVASTYGYDHVDKVYRSLQTLKRGKALFTQPAGVLKCAGAPQKIMWLALDHWKQAGLYNPADPAKSAIQIAFATGLPAMFGVPKYSASLEALRQERGVEPLFQHDLVAVEGNTATFAKVDGSGAQVQREFDMLHVVPKMGPHAFVKNSPLADAAGFVDVDPATTQHKKFKNVWSLGDASSLPTSKTAAAITAQAPIMVRNLLRVADGQAPDAEYDGYTSCPLTTEYGKVLLAEFKYAGVPKETFGGLLGIDQATPRRAFWHMKKSFFPWVYYNNMVKGTWAGPKGWLS
ncbi:putative pyridine nucleotide-disulfide oxidoreductase [Aspergillus homomorphus CBS 101889]|uniref:Putative pyridine nucleotide-disulfide oxidoreductase n=1 Tax=Aspergillus homomorphus (strain CBS 101889) TaxID=1450537 RepID=A0A395I1T0_ASPHC|nr:putative pyridine nucleotide-disulfide oxidoreductase [Aspergillus homomorphus CBS 101889]RAL13128.1 putative pyridine nucleotide-disulfide oxidoreductase [Aspergillus homomorphus CBS 101889]